MKRPFPLITASFRQIVVWLIAVDILFIGANVVGALLKRRLIIDEMPMWLVVSEDGALPEDFNYLKWVVIVSALAWIALRDHLLPPLIWALVFAMILLDDSLQLHEKIGHRIATDMHIPSAAMLRGSDLGEIIVFLMMGLIAAALTAMLFTRFGPSARNISLHYLAVLLALGFFGVGIDALHQMIGHLTSGMRGAGRLDLAMALAEDGGEMIVASIATAFTLAPPAVARGAGTGAATNDGWSAS